jgi:hypothetical protein
LLPSFFLYSINSIFKTDLVPCLDFSASLVANLTVYLDETVLNKDFCMATCLCNIAKLEK